MTIRAVVVKDGMKDSEIASASYQIHTEPEVSENGVEAPDDNNPALPDGGAGQHAGSSSAVDTLETGDNFNRMLWAAVLILSGAWLIIEFVLGRKKKQNRA